MKGGMAEDPSKPVLDDHARVGKKLMPPFIAALGGRYSPYSWARQLVPEAVWMALVIDRCGFERACRICLELAEAAAHVAANSASPSFARCSDFLILTPPQKARVAGTLKSSVREALIAALRPLSRVIEGHPLAFLEAGAGSASAVEDRLAPVLRELYDRNSRLSVLSMAVGEYLGIRLGKMHMPAELLEEVIERFKVIDAYPETEAAQRAAGMFRASAPMIFMSPDEEGHGFAESDPWLREFWDAIAGFGPCLFPETLEDEEPGSDDPLEAFVIDYRNAVRADLRARLNRWRVDLHEVEAYEVVAALLCRQATLALELASSPGIWNPHTAPIILRAMADMFVSLAWILKDPGPRSSKYIDDGLGTIKLQIAHQKRFLETATDEDDIRQSQEMIEIWTAWLASQRMDQFVEVNLGSWSGLNTRRMAEEAGCLDFYNYVYQPFSAAVHSNWAHVSMFNSVHCENPAHRLHRSPAIAPAGLDPGWLLLAAKYLSKTLAHFDEVNELKDLPHNAFDLVGSRLSRDAGEAESAKGAPISEA